MTPTSAQSLAPLIAIPLVIIVLALRLRGLTRGRRLRVEWLWVMPTLLLAISVVVVVMARPAGLDWLWLGLAFAIGAVLGWQRGRLIHISVDPESHELTSKASPAALIFIVALIALRYVLRWGAVTYAASWHISVLMVTDCLLVFALGLLGVQRLEMWLRGRRLVTEARAAKTPPG